MEHKITALRKRYRFDSKYWACLLYKKNLLLKGYGAWLHSSVNVLNTPELHSEMVTIINCTLYALYHNFNNF